MNNTKENIKIIEEMIDSHMGWPSEEGALREALSALKEKCKRLKTCKYFCKQTGTCKSPLTNDQVCACGTTHSRATQQQAKHRSD